MTTPTNLPKDFDPRFWKMEDGIEDLIERISYMLYEDILVTTTPYWAGEANQYVISPLAVQYYLIRDINLSLTTTEQIRKALVNARNEIISFDSAEEKLTQRKIKALGIKLACGQLVENTINVYSEKNKLSREFVIEDLLEKKLIRLSKSGDCLPIVTEGYR